jgi:two-component sensor histidine kinase
MLIRTVRIAVGSFLSILFVTAVALGCIVVAPVSAAPIFAIMCLVFAAVAIVGGRVQASLAVVVGALELAFILPGEGFAVSEPDQALGLIATIATGSLMSWYVGRMNTVVATHEIDIATSRQIADLHSVAHSELAHRLTNDLSIMVSLATGKGHQAVNPEARDVLTELVGRLIVLGRVYHRLDLRDRERTNAVNARDFLLGLCDDLRLSTFSTETIALRLDVDESLWLPSTTLNLLGLIINELLTNVRKHAYPEGEGGQVTLFFHRHAFRTDCLEMIVTDNGSGFAGGAVEQRGMGRNLLTMLADQIGGDIGYSRILGATVATLQFPAPAATSPGADQERKGVTSRAVRADQARSDAIH